MEWKLPRRPKDIVIASVCCVLVLVSLSWAVLKLRRPPVSNVEYFTVDDGQSWFALPSPHFASFDQDGKQAVQAFLYQGSNGKPFVGYLMKYSPRAQRALMRANEAPASGDAPLADTIRDEDRLFKRPGESEWVVGSDPAAADIWSAVTDPKTKAPAQRYHGG
jgi:hypothetical protein